LILRKIIPIVATRCQILWLKSTKFDFGCMGPAPDPAGFKGPTSKGREGKRREKKGRKGREVTGKKRKERQKSNPPPVKISQIQPCMDELINF